MATTTNNGWTTPNDSDAFKLGASAIRTLGDGIDTSVGTGLLTWTAYTPSLSGLTLGNGTLAFYYAKLGKTVNVRGTITFGSTSVITTAVDIGVPFNMPTTNGYVFAHPFGFANYYNGSNIFYGTNVYVGNTSSLRAVATQVAGTYATSVDLNASIPFTWSTGRQLFVNYTYQAA
jgi:hypothetical protein